MHTQTTYYDELEVGRLASPEVIKAAYRALANRWHPDKHPTARETAERRMKSINLAYGLLSDPMTRRRYDERLDLVTQPRQAGEDAKAYSDLGPYEAGDDAKLDPKAPPRDGHVSPGPIRFYWSGFNDISPPRHRRLSKRWLCGSALLGGLIGLLSASSGIALLCVIGAIALWMASRHARWTRPRRAQAVRVDYRANDPRVRYVW